MKNTNYYSIGEAAKLVGFPGGRNKFYSWMRENEILNIQNYPEQKYRSNKWFVEWTKTYYYGMNIYDKHGVFITQLGLDEIRKLVMEYSKELSEENSMEVRDCQF